MAGNTYVNNTISFISEDTMVSQSGTITKNINGTLTFVNNSDCTFEYNYESADQFMSDFLKLMYGVVDGTSSIGTRYRNQVRIDVTIDYYEESYDSEGVFLGYIDGGHQFARILPYLQHETEGYIGGVEIPLVNKYIKKITLKLAYVNETASTVTFEYVRMYNSRTTSEVVRDTYGMSITLDKVVGYTNGCEVYYTNEKNPLVLVWQEDALGDFSGIKMNPGTDTERIIPFTKVNDYLVD